MRTSGNCWRRVVTWRRFGLVAMLDDARLPIVDVVRWAKRYQTQLDKRYAEREDQRFRRIARVVASAWLKYRLTDRDDIEQYAYYAVLVNSRFDVPPEVQRIVETAAGKPGMFAKSMRSLPKRVLFSLSNNAFEAAAVPVIFDGLPPPPRAKDAPHGGSYRVRIGRDLRHRRPDSSGGTQRCGVSLRLPFATARSTHSRSECCRNRCSNRRTKISSWSPCRPVPDVMLRRPYEESAYA